MSWTVELKQIVQDNLSDEAPYIIWEENLIHVPNVWIGEDIMALIESSDLEIEATLDTINLVVMVSEGRQYF